MPTDPTPALCPATRRFGVAAAVSLLALATAASAQTLWENPSFTFTDPGNSSIADEITPNVIITRGRFMGIYNAAVESSFTGMGDVSPSPIGTEWAFGRAADFATLTFTTWGGAHMGNPSSLIGQDMVVHLVDDDIYMELRFLSWGGADSGGAYSYIRAVPAPGASALIAAAGLLTARRRRRPHSA